MMNFNDIPTSSKNLVCLSSPSQFNTSRPLAVSTPINDDNKKRKDTQKIELVCYEEDHQERIEEESDLFHQNHFAEFWTCAEDVGSEHSSCDDIFSHLDQ